MQPPVEAMIDRSALESAMYLPGKWYVEKKSQKMGSIPREKMEKTSNERTERRTHLTRTTWKGSAFKGKSGYLRRLKLN